MTIKNTGYSARVAVFASGRGSNFEAMLKKKQSGDLDNAEFCVVITNNPKAGIIATAEKNCIPCRIISGNESDSEIIALLEEYKAEFIVLAGYLKMIGKDVINHYPNRILNIHPGPLPQFGGKGKYGIHVHEAVIAAKAITSAVTIHYVDNEYDHGKIIQAAKVEVKIDDTPHTLQERVLKVEHEIYWKVLKQEIEKVKGIPGK